jgi:aromatic-L-amino-acid decarboxylase
MSDDAPARIDPEEFRRLGHRLVDWIADYHRRVAELPILSRAAPGDLLRALPEAPPEAGCGEPGWDQILADLDALIVPGLTHWQSPHFHAYFPCNASTPGILGELASAGLGIQGMLWSTSPAATELEERVLDWLAQLMALPERLRAPAGGGVIQGTASEAALVAMVAARHRMGTGRDAELVAYASTQAHSSIVKAAKIAGICDDADGTTKGGRRTVRFIPTDGRHGMEPEALRAAIQEDREQGRVPFFVCATVGTTSSGAVDPLPAIGRVLTDTGFAATGGWLHVDAAWAGSAAVCPEHQELLHGLERADSYTFNPHKWLLTNFDCSAFWTTDRDSLVAALGVTPEYLRNRATDAGQVVDYRDWQIPLGRRFRALKLWFVLRHFGAEGLRAHIRHHVALGKLFEELVATDPDFELAAERSLSLVCFRLRGQDADDKGRQLLDALNAEGRTFLSHTSLTDPATGRPRFVLRMAIGAAATRAADIHAAWDRIRAHAARLLRPGSEPTA